MLSFSHLVTGKYQYNGDITYILPLLCIIIIIIFITEFFMFFFRRQKKFNPPPKIAKIFDCWVCFGGHNAMLCSFVCYCVTVLLT